ncbi:vitamin K epoxide reductase family protein [Streptomyces bambusae]|uniref:vitamin K epoxide reductase family protein n=1 Tax=Streptomyces bambusae TaxID=1550616 RepID=UPI001CFE4DD3|nr:vitamin K epoxide reductase family protein [Streptomyces bambusae]MCB5164366.1 vitamin K epoxide reductase family protein [Streptomyces bambusae]
MIIAPLPRRSRRGLPLLLLVSGLLGALASGVLAYDRIRMLEDPRFTPGCNVNAVLSCGDVMSTWQSSVLGVPNVLLGLAGFGVLAGLGLALLAGAEFARWLWLLVQAGVTAAFGFVLWLFTQCLYVIGALCPWCVLVWAVVVPLFWYVTRHVVRLPRTLAEAPHWLVPLLLYAVMAGLTAGRFA